MSSVFDAWEEEFEVESFGDTSLSAGDVGSQLRRAREELKVLSDKLSSPERIQESFNSEFEVAAATSRVSLLNAEISRLQSQESDVKARGERVLRELKRFLSGEMKKLGLSEEQQGQMMGIVRNSVNGLVKNGVHLSSEMASMGKIQELGRVTLRAAWGEMTFPSGSDSGPEFTSGSSAGSSEPEKTAEELGREEFRNELLSEFRKLREPPTSMAAQRRRAAQERLEGDAR